jgi:hypothetical protein
MGNWQSTICDLRFAIRDIDMVNGCFFKQDTLIEKLRLKNSTFRVQKKKLQMQLKQVRCLCCKANNLRLVIIPGHNVLWF